MSIETAKTYFERSDNPDASVEDVVNLFANDAVLKSPREGAFRGIEGIEEFFQLTKSFSTMALTIWRIITKTAKLSSVKELLKAGQHLGGSMKASDSST